MIQKISISVRVPSVQKTHDFVLPENMSIKKVISLMSLTIADEYSSTSKGSDTLMLIDQKDNTVLNKECSLKQLGIKNGAKLMFI